MIVLGIDCSTNTVGWAIIEHKTTGKYQTFLKKADFIRLDRMPKNFIERAEFVALEFKKIFEKYGTPDRVHIENNLESFRQGQTSVKVIVTLAKFNAVVSYLVYKLTKVPLAYFHPSSARKKAWGWGKAPIGVDAKTATLHEVQKFYPEVFIDFPTRPIEAFFFSFNPFYPMYCLTERLFTFAVIKRFGFINYSFCII